MSSMASQITSLTIIYSTVYSDTDQRKHQSSASLPFVQGIHRGPVNSPHKWPVTQKMFPFDDVIMSKDRGIPIHILSGGQRLHWKCVHERPELVKSHRARWARSAVLRNVWWRTAKPLLSPWWQVRGPVNSPKLIHASLDDLEWYRPPIFEGAVWYFSFLMHCLIFFRWELHRKPRATSRTQYTLRWMAKCVFRF